MKINYKFLIILLNFLTINSVFAQDEKVATGYAGPKLSGSVLYQFQGDHIISSSKNSAKSSNGFVYIEPNFGLHFDEKLFTMNVPPKSVI